MSSISFQRNPDHGLFLHLRVRSATALDLLPVVPEWNTQRPTPHQIAHFPFSAERASSSNLLPTGRSPAMEVRTSRNTYLQGEGCSRVCDVPVSRETSLIIRQSGAAGCGVLSKAAGKQLRYRPRMFWRCASTRIPTPAAWRPKRGYKPCWFNARICS